MLNETDKSLSCSIEDCDMTFTNEDHLKCHEKKHDMKLNLAAASKNSDGDQTPTPTRFIRNCEEMGLFQDLQNVNPFEEIFKKAVTESSNLDVKNATLNVPANGLTNDGDNDTLHTPHIFPSVEEPSVKFLHSHSSNVASLNDFITDYSIMSVTDTAIHIEDSNEKSQIISAKARLKEALRNKKPYTPSVRTERPYKLIKYDDQGIGRLHDEEDSLMSREMRKEMNRAAQLRCRKRKKQRISLMEEENERLKAVNKRLMLDNAKLKSENVQLNKIVLDLVQKQQNKTNDIEVASVSASPSPSSSSNSVYIALMPQVVISANNNDNKNIVILKNPKDKLERKKAFRNIVPKTD